MLYSDAIIKEMNDHLASISEKYGILKKRILQLKLKSDLSREHASHGIARRLGVITRCINQVFYTLPPNLKNIPDRDQVLDASIYLQSFIINLFGLCENVAWIWVSENDVKKPDGTDIRETDIGLGKKYKIVRSSLTTNFREYLDSREVWFSYIKNFRDALAHRIPLYIPPYTVKKSDKDSYERMESESLECLYSFNIEKYEEIQNSMDGMKIFQPMIAHSLYDGSKSIFFHPQMIVDFYTVEEIIEKLMAELSGLKGREIVIVQ